MAQRITRRDATRRDAIQHDTTRYETTRDDRTRYEAIQSDTTTSDTRQNELAAINIERRIGSTAHEECARARAAPVACIAGTGPCEVGVGRTLSQFRLESAIVFPPLSVLAASALTLHSWPHARVYTTCATFHFGAQIRRAEPVRHDGSGRGMLSVSPPDPARLGCALRCEGQGRVPWGARGVARTVLRAWFGQSGVRPHSAWVRGTSGGGSTTSGAVRSRPVPGRCRSWVGLGRVHGS